MGRIRFIYILSFLTPLCGLVISLNAQKYPVYPDGIGNYWTITDYLVKKVNQQGATLVTYSNMLLGKPSSIDVSDPFRILVFYQQGQNIVILNNNAAVLGKPISIPEMDLGEVTLVCRSALGGAWLLNRETAELLRYGNQLNTIEQRISLDPLLLTYQHLCMLEQGGILFIGIGKDGIARYDIYGASLPSLHIPNDGYFSIHENFLWAKDADLALRFNLSYPLEKPQVYRCPCYSLPVLITNQPACYDGERFIFCKKIER